MVEKISLLWERQEVYEDWIKSINEKSNEYIIDFNLEQIFDEINNISSFKNFFTHKNIFLYPVSDNETIHYRQKIVNDIYQNKKLYEILKSYVYEMGDFEKVLLRVNHTKDDFKRKVFFIENLYNFLDRLKEYLCIFKQDIPERSVLRCLIELISQYADTSEINASKEIVKSYLNSLDKAFSYHVILNKGPEQSIMTVAVNKNYEDQAPDFTKKLSLLSDFLFDSYDWNISVYQDVDITALDKLLHDKVIKVSPKLLEETNTLYEEFRYFPFQIFFSIAYDLSFYITYIDFMMLYEQKGFYFTLPKISDDTSICVKDAYDLSLGINQYKKLKLNQTVSNDYEINEKERIFILTGANQGGKTTFIRSMGIIQCLFQIGLYVPAKIAELRIVDHIYTHFSRGDNSSVVVGRFEQELQDMNYILDHITSKDMFFFNESFTSTQRSVAVILLNMILHKLSDLGCIGGLVTHFHEIMKDLSLNCVISLITMVNNDTSFHDRTYKIVKRAPEYKSYAYDIAKKCGVTFEQLMIDLDSLENRD